jgi:hypothetical protein
MKRFTDTAVSRRPWFRKLSPRLKCAVRFLFDECDNAGVWIIDMDTMEHFVGEPVTLAELFSEVNSDKPNRIEKFDTDKIFIPNFVRFQYGELSENCKPHKPIISLLKNYGLYERVLKGYSKGIDTLEEKEQEQEKEKDKETEKEKDFGKSENLLDESFIVPQMWEVWKENFPHYTHDKKSDFPALASMLGFMLRQSSCNDPTDTNTQIKILNGMQLIADQVKADQFWISKPLKSVANHIQEFTNKAKNGTAKQTANSTKRQQINQKFAERYGKG